MEHNTLKSSRMRGAIIIWITCCAFFWFDKMSADLWVDLTKWIFAIYSTSEGVVKGVDALKKKV